MVVMYMSANILKPTPGTHVKSENFSENYMLQTDYLSRQLEADLINWKSE